MAKERGMTTEYFLFGKYHFTPTALRKLPMPSRVPGSGRCSVNTRRRKGKERENVERRKNISSCKSLPFSDGGSAGVTN